MHIPILEYTFALCFKSEHAYKDNQNFEIMAKILTERGERMLLGKLFGVSQPTIRRALNGMTQTELARKIRRVALLRGGVEKSGATEPNAGLKQPGSR